MLSKGAARAGSFTSGLPQLVDRMRYTLYGKHRRTTIDASSSARPPVSRPPQLECMLCTQHSGEPVPGSTSCIRHARLALAAREHAERCHSSCAWSLCGPC